MDNFFIEMEKVSQCVDQNFNYVSMVSLLSEFMLFLSETLQIYYEILTFSRVLQDTEYPGTVYLPSEVTSVRHLKLTTVGLRLPDNAGECREFEADSGGDYSF